MTLTGMLTVVRGRWHVAFAGLLVAAVLAALTFLVVPAQYTSSGVLLVVQPKRSSALAPGAATTANPLLAFGDSLNTTAVVITQTLNSPDTAAGLGLRRGVEKFTAKNVGTVDTGGSPNQPLIFITAQSTVAGRTTEIVNSVAGLARQNLADQQETLKVGRRDRLTLLTVNPAGPPKVAPGVALAAAVAAFSVTFALAIALCVALHKREERLWAGHGGVVDRHTRPLHRQPTFNPPEWRQPDDWDLIDGRRSR